MKLRLQFLFFYMFFFSKGNFYIQSTLAISNSKGLSEILRDIRTSTHQNCRIEEKINPTTTFNKCICNFAYEVRYIENIVEKRRNCS